MAYTVDYSDGTKTAITVNDGTIDTTTSLSLVGKNYYGYGEVIAENFLHLLEHFASATAPTNPPIPIIAGKTPRNMNQTSQDVVFPFITVLGPGISANASRKVFFVTTTYLLISA